jgi:hypothetical protein
MLVLQTLKYHLLEAMRLIWPYLPCHKSGVKEVKLFFGESLGTVHI